MWVSRPRRSSRIERPRMGRASAISSVMLIAGTAGYDQHQGICVQQADRGEVGQRVVRRLLERPARWFIGPMARAEGEPFGRGMATASLPTSRRATALFDHHVARAVPCMYWPVRRATTSELRRREGTTILIARCGHGCAAGAETAASEERQQTRGAAAAITCRPAARSGGGSTSV